jgi:hypothetical protein
MGLESCELLKDSERMKPGIAGLFIV